MSRITKEEIEKTKCGRFLLSDENIYLSIYSLNSYVFEYNLLNTEDRILYHRLQDKFDARLINGVITRVREQIIELFDKDKYIEAKVYFKPKKLSENGELEFRPLHSTGLITQIAIVYLYGQGLWSMQVNAIRRQHLLVKKILTEIYEIYFQKIILFSFHLIR